MNPYSNQAESFSGQLNTAGRRILAAGSVILSAVSAGTTWGGLATVMSATPAGFTAAGIQAIVLGGFMLFSHAPNLRARAFGLTAALVAEIPSALFTFVFFFALFNAKVAPRENAIIGTDSFHQQQSALQVFGERCRSRELEELADNGNMAKAEVRVLSADENTRRREAEYLGVANRQLQLQLATAEPDQQDAIHAKIRRNERLIKTLSTDAKAIRLQIATSEEQAGQLDTRRTAAEAYQPDFLDVHDGDWAGLRAGYTKLAGEYSQLSNTAGLVMPAAPNEPTHGINGEALRGQQEPFYELLTRIWNPWDAVLWWAAFLTAAIELAGVFAMWAVRAVSRDWPAAAYERGIWMRRMLRAIGSSGGVFPFAGKALYGVLFGQPVRTGHVGINRFEDLIEDTLLRMKTELRQASAPQALVSIIEAKLENLGGELIYRNYTAVADSDEKVIDTLDECLAAIRAASLQPDTQHRLEQLIHGQAERIRTMYRSNRNEMGHEAEETQDGGDGHQNAEREFGS